MKEGDFLYVIPYGVPDNPEAKEEAIRTGNCIRTRIHGSRLPPYQPLGIRIHFAENGEVTWEHWDGKEKEGAVKAAEATRGRTMTKIYCSECGRFVAEVDLLEQGEVVSATCSACETQLAQIDAEERDVEYYARLLERDPKERARRRKFLRGMNVLVFGDRDNGPKPKEEGE